MPEKYKQKKADWALVFTLTMLYALVFNSYYHTSFSRVLAQAGWEKSLNLLVSANGAGVAVGAVLIILLTKRWSVPHSYLTIGSGWGLFSCMLATGYLLIFHTPPLWGLIVLRFFEGIGLTILFQSCLHLFHWGTWHKVKAWEFEDKQQLELVIGREQTRRNNLIFCLAIPCGIFSFWQLGDSNSTHPAWFLTAIIAMGVFTLLTLGTIRFPKELTFEGSSPESDPEIATKPTQSTISLRKLYIGLLGVMGPLISIVAVGTYLPVYTTVTLVPLITLWGTLSMVLGTKLISKIHPCWNSALTQGAYGLIGIGLLLMWSSHHSVVLALAMSIMYLGVAMEQGVVARVLLVHMPESQKMMASVVRSLSEKTAQVMLIPLFGFVANYFSIRWMWLSLLLMIPVGFVSLKRFSLLQPSAEDLQKRQLTLVSQVVGFTFFLSRKW